MFRHISLSLLLATGATIAEKCQHPPPSENYSNQLYAGQWFEVMIMKFYEAFEHFLPGGEIPDNWRSHFPDRDSLYRGKF